MRRRGGLRRGSHPLLWPVKAARKHAAEPLPPQGLAALADSHRAGAHRWRQKVEVSCHGCLLLDPLHTGVVNRCSYACTVDRDHMLVMLSHDPHHPRRSRIQAEQHLVWDGRSARRQTGCSRKRRSGSCSPPAVWWETWCPCARTREHGAHTHRCQACTTRMERVVHLNNCGRRAAFS